MDGMLPHIVAIVNSAPVNIGKHTSFYLFFKN